ncbi:DUF4113 domain-containing protein [Pseudomonas sp. 2822-15]
MRLASVPTAPSWAMRRDLVSQSYTAKVDQLRTVNAGSRCEGLMRIVDGF